MTSASPIITLSNRSIIFSFFFQEHTWIGWQLPLADVSPPATGIEQHDTKPCIMHGAFVTSRQFLNDAVVFRYHTEIIHKIVYLQKLCRRSTEHFIIRPPSATRNRRSDSQLKRSVHVVGEAFFSDWNLGTFSHSNFMFSFALKCSERLFKGKQCFHYTPNWLKPR